MTKLPNEVDFCSSLIIIWEMSKSICCLNNFYLQKVWKIRWNQSAIGYHVYIFLCDVLGINNLGLIKLMFAVPFLVWQVVLLLSCILAFFLNYSIFLNTTLNSALTQTICGNLKVCALIFFYLPWWLTHSFHRFLFILLSFVSFVCLSWSTWGVMG